MRWALCGGILLTAGCVTHRGPWRLEPPPPAADGVELILLANTAPATSDNQRIAARLHDVLAEDRPRLVLWLGNMAATPRASATPLAVRRGPRCSLLDNAWAGSNAALAQTVRTHAGPDGFGTVGVHDHRCGHGAALRPELSLDEPPDSPEPLDSPGPPDSPDPWSDSLHPFRMPATHYVLRVLDDGSTQIRARCADGTCRFDRTPAPSERRPLVDLVVVDLSPWLYPSSEPAARRRDEQQVQALDVLLQTLAQTPPRAAPPRLLVSSVPVEAAGEHGLGTLRPDATVHNLPTELQTLLVEGHFAGVLAAHDRSLYATPDLSDALKRADRIWLRTPVFQVVAGAVSRPNNRAAMALRRRRVRRSQAFHPPVWSDHAGFAVVHLLPDQARITLHARRGRRWETASMPVPLRPEPHPATTPSPVMTPCRDCPPIPAIER